MYLLFAILALLAYPESIILYGKVIYYFNNLDSFALVCMGINPWWITGFTDGEGSFTIRHIKKDQPGLGYSFQLVFRIAQLSVDSALINTFPEFFGVGYVSTATYNNTTVTTYTTSSLEAAFVIIKHFEKYPLLTKKSLDFEDWKTVAIMLKNKEHHSPKGFEKILAIKAGMNKGRK